MFNFAQILINYVIFWMSVTRNWRCIYVNYFNLFQDFCFLLRLAQNFKKCSFLDNVRTITQKTYMKSRQINPFFHLVFPLYLFVKFTFIFQNSQNSFSCGHTFGQFWSVKYPNFWQKLPDQTAHHTFLESIQTWSL